MDVRTSLEFPKHRFHCQDILRLHLREPAFWPLNGLVLALEAIYLGGFEWPKEAKKPRIQTLW